jgi:hypothetical protein
MFRDRTQNHSHARRLETDFTPRSVRPEGTCAGQWPKLCLRSCVSQCLFEDIYVCTCSCPPPEKDTEHGQSVKGQWDARTGLIPQSCMCDELTTIHDRTNAPTFARSQQYGRTPAALLGYRGETREQESSHSARDCQLSEVTTTATEAQ